MKHGEPSAPAPTKGSAVGATGAPSPTPRFRAFDVRLYDACDAANEVLIYFLLIATPWAFGTTQPHVIWTMNGIAYALGVLLAIQGMLCHFRGYRPPRWEVTPGKGPRLLTWLTRLLAVLTVAVLAYCLISALNARSSWQPKTNTFAYYDDTIPWLPQSYDGPGTWRTFWNYTALACAFWAVRGWLLGMTRTEQRAGQRQARGLPSRNAGLAALLPGRLRRLLWVLCVNGALLGIEGITQRLSGSTKLLWLVQPTVNRDALSQFGPYAYRANAAQYFNLLWPVCLGFWWMLHRTGGFKRWVHHLLLPSGVIMAACPVIATTRGGALVTGALIVLAALFLSLSPIFLDSRRWHSPRAALLTFLLLCGFFIGAAMLAFQLGWGDLEGRMTEMERGYEAREHIFATGRKMADEYRWYGTGPGTFNPLFQLYRSSLDEYWPAELHNDWLETRITFGRIGMTMVLLALLIVLARWFVPGGIHGGRRFVVLIWLALAGCLAHARYDLPFQIYSIVLLFLTLCAVLFTLSRRGG